MKRALNKLNRLSENVRLVDEPRRFSHSEVENLIKIAYLEGKLEYIEDILFNKPALEKQLIEKQLDSLD